MPPGARRAAARTGRAAVPLAALLLAVIAAAFSNALEASFQFDDWEVIVRDPRVQDPAAWWASMPGIRPLLKLSYALNHASGLGVAGFHAVNVAIHGLVALLVGALALRLVQRSAAGGGPPSDGRTGATGHAAFAFATALLFALHPLQTEAVTYASGRSTSLSTGFALASLLLGIAALDAAPGPDRGRRRLCLAASLVAMGLALAVKESAVVVPAALVLWRATDPARPATLGALLRCTAPHWLALLAGLVAVLGLPAYRHLLATSLAIRTPLENLAAQSHAVPYLLGQIVRIDRLNADPALPVDPQLDAAELAGLIALAGGVAWAWHARRRAPIAAFAVPWTVLWLLPTNSLLARLDLVNDRQAYAALVGPALLVAAGLRGLAGRKRAGPVLAGIALLVLAAGLGVATHRRNAVYRDEVVFWQAVIDGAPHNARAYNNLGVALAERQDTAGAIEAWRRALALDPGFVRAAVNLRLALEGAPETSPSR